MQAVHTLLVALCAVAAATCQPVSAAEPEAAPGCRAAGDAGNASGLRIADHDSAQLVKGTGRLQFHTAPDAGCVQKGVFILSGEPVNGYVAHKGYTSVMYVNPKTGRVALGWVESARLKPQTVSLARGN
jgi:hypothetical protein